jgi:hypothetical protein
MRVAVRGCAMAHHAPCLRLPLALLSIFSSFLFFSEMEPARELPIVLKRKSKVQSTKLEQTNLQQFLVPQ